MIGGEQSSLLLVLHAIVLLLGIAMLVRPTAFLSGGSTRVQGVRVIGVVLVLWAAANFISALR
jgi:hypothetical protein